MKKRKNPKKKIKRKKRRLPKPTKKRIIVNLYEINYEIKKIKIKKKETKLMILIQEIIRKIKARTKNSFLLKII